MLYVPVFDYATRVPSSCLTPTTLQPQKFEIKEVPIPKCGDDDLLLKGTVPVLHRIHGLKSAHFDRI